jgi:hypothetical protein
MDPLVVAGPFGGGKRAVLQALGRLLQGRLVAAPVLTTKERPEGTHDGETDGVEEVFPRLPVHGLRASRCVQVPFLLGACVRMHNHCGHLQTTFQVTWRWCPLTWQSAWSKQGSCSSTSRCEAGWA